MKNYNVSNIHSIGLLFVKCHIFTRNIVKNEIRIRRISRLTGSDISYVLTGMISFAKGFILPLGTKGR